MKDIYNQIWELAKVYYLQGRPMDIDHIEWFMIQAIKVCQRENLDDTILLPLAILHDVGYSIVKDEDKKRYYDQDIRKAHMQAGKDIAEQILKQVNYPPEKIQKIINYIAVHDNWAFGETEIYKNDPLLGTFKDLDYIWIYTEKGCETIQGILHKTDEEMLLHLQNELSPIGGKKPFSNPTTQQLHDEYLKERELAFSQKRTSKEHI